jgi:hypothetical protein
MVGDGKYNKRYDTYFNQGLNRVKCIGRERRRIERPMVYHVHGFIKWLPVQQAVCPVKISVVYKDHQQYAEKIIRPAVLVDRIVDQCPAVFAGPHHLHNHNTKNKNGVKGVTYFAVNVLPVGEALLYL